MAWTPLREDDPSELHGYRLLGRLGQGGMGVVYLARDAAGDEVAVKTILGTYATEKEFQQRFARETQILQSLRDPHIISVLAAFPDPRCPCLVTEYVPGPTLADRLREEGALTPQAARALALDLARALEAVHARGVVHRDLKPSNVLLGPHGTKVIDFGIARLVDGDDLTRTGHLPGTPGYLAPELATGRQQAGPEADVFAWALTVGHAVRGRGCFGEGGTVEIQYRCVYDAPELDGIPDDLLPLISSALDKDPGRRPSSRELVNALRRADWATAPRTEPTGAAHPGASASTDTPKRPRRRRLTAAVAAATLAVVAVTAYTWLHTSSNTCSAGLHRAVNDECVGVADPLSDASLFGPELKDVVGRIVRENKRVADEAAADPRKPYVRVAHLMPYGADSGSPLSWEAIRESLEGAYAAQCRVNACPGLRGAGATHLPATVPKVQLLLANEGRNQQEWKVVADQLGTMTSGDHPVVGVSGLGVSLPETQAVADRLSELKIPAVAGPPTATTLESPYLFKASPSNREHVRALRARLESGQAERRGFLVFDTNEDLYVQSLREAFDLEFAPSIGQRRAGFAGSTDDAAVPRLYGPAVQDICYTKADVVFYAGRDNDFPALISALANRGRCSPDGGLRPLTVVTCWSGRSAYSRNPERQKELRKAKITVLDASVLSPEDWNRGSTVPPGFAPFHESFQALGYTDRRLGDGYAMMNHDAVLTVAWAAESFANQNGGAVPGPQDLYNQIINLHGANRVAAASGDLEFFHPSDVSRGWAKGARLTINTFG
ncbi:bifunctional serine/threonine-protein kinase/ABC transporter substrate-binding protein [Streptomyces sp. NPDC059175]|uniref:bifunctional serine/threonine-protein kinase/ABC transporter substrate-binding protein n=1 Tax=Streptomyces sp. NPDC059175 TaxID=3346757 RepID=UPI0036B38B9A